MDRETIGQISGKPLNGKITSFSQHDNEIRLKKETIRKEIDADDAKIQTLWNSLFTKPEILSRNASPSKRLQSLLQVGAGAFDGALLAWKLYRRFKPRKR